jgi:hypothetical protein
VAKGIEIVVKGGPKEGKTVIANLLLLYLRRSSGFSDQVTLIDDSHELDASETRTRMEQLNRDKTLITIRTEPVKKVFSPRLLDLEPAPPRPKYRKMDTE